ncbi:nucleoid-associated protein, partial [Escherichia marmotae]|nr:nucleoid-associated protein [Escherichia marmotae]
THNIDVVDDKVEINIIPQFIGLPSSGQKIQKCAFIKPIREENNFDLMVIDKNSGKKDEDEYGSNYFINNYLGCKIINNERDLTKTFVKSA